jgi:hypothetical protein
MVLEHASPCCPQPPPHLWTPKLGTGTEPGGPRPPLSASTGSHGTLGKNGPATGPGRSISGGFKAPQFVIHSVRQPICFRPSKNQADLEPCKGVATQSEGWSRLVSRVRVWRDCCAVTEAPSRTASPPVRPELWPGCDPHQRAQGPRPWTPQPTRDAAMSGYVTTLTAMPYRYDSFARQVLRSR